MLFINIFYGPGILLITSSVSCQIEINSGLRRGLVKRLIAKVVVGTSAPRGEEHHSVHLITLD